MFGRDFGGDIFGHPISSTLLEDRPQHYPTAERHSRYATRSQAVPFFCSAFRACQVKKDKEDKEGKAKAKALAETLVKAKAKAKARAKARAKAKAKAKAKARAKAKAKAKAEAEAKAKAEAETVPGWDSWPTEGERTPDSLGCDPPIETYFQPRNFNPAIET